VIVIDTSVWSDVLNDIDSRPARTCIELIEGGEPVALTDVIFAQLLQRLRSDVEATELERHLRAFPVLRLSSLHDFALAASLYRAARGKGITIRKTLDYLIAAPCVRANAPLLHTDKDSDPLAAAHRCGSTSPHAAERKSGPVELGDRRQIAGL
jgi:predicted nucleic acid-binding protein